VEKEMGLLRKVRCVPHFDFAGQDAPAAFGAAVGAGAQVISAPRA